MAAYLEVWTPAGQKFVTLAAGPAGRDTAVSRAGLIFLTG